MKYIAQYVDCVGNSFSCPVTKLTGQWVLATANGPREISFYIYGSDCAGGFATFRDFRLDDVPRGLRGCDYGELCKQMYKVLPWPTPPAEPPTPISQPEDFRVHIEPDNNSFRALQTAGAKGEMEYREGRQQARQQALQTLNEPDVRKIQEARRVNNEYAAQIRPHGKGAAFVIKNGE